MSMTAPSISCNHGRGFNCATCWPSEQKRAAMVRDSIEWQACQGNKKAQRIYADILEAEGRNDWAEFYRAKADGTTQAFTLEAFKASKH